MAKRLFGKPLIIPRPGSGPAPVSAPNAAVPAAKAPSAKPVIEQKITDDDIARAAYFRWLKCGGTSEENWAAAERELREQAQAE